jgi:hypothetical protein
MKHFTGLSLYFEKETSVYNAFQDINSHFVGFQEGTRMKSIKGCEIQLLETESPDVDHYEVEAKRKNTVLCSHRVYCIATAFFRFSLLKSIAYYCQFEVPCVILYKDRVFRRYDHCTV